MKKQEIFDKVATHLLAQGKPAVKKDATSTYACQYRTRSGASCAIGCLIPDEFYFKGLEGSDVMGLFIGNINMTKAQRSKLVGLKRLLGDGKRDFLQSMQCLHDNPSNWDSPNNKSPRFDKPKLISSLRQFAKDHKLRWRHIPGLTPTP